MADTTTLEIELTGAQITELDAWIANQGEPRPSRAKAIERLLAQTLGGGEPRAIPVEDLNSSNDE